MDIKQKLIKEFFENYIDRATGKIYLLDKAQLQPKLEQLLDDYKQQVSVEPEVKVNFAEVETEIEDRMIGKLIKGNLNGQKVAEQWINVNNAILIAKQILYKYYSKISA